MARKTGLSDALAKAAQGRTDGKGAGKATQHAAPAARVGASPGKAKPHRAGRVNITGYFDPAVKQSLLAIQGQYLARGERRTAQSLLAEALNDLFAKYNVPQTAHLGEGE